MSVVDFVPGMDFRKGFSTLRGTTRGDGVTADAPSEIDGAAGQIINFSILRVNSLEDFQSALDIDVKVSGSYKLFSASGSFEWSDKQKFNNYSEYLVAKVTVENPLRMIHNVKLTDSAFNLLREGRSDRFQEQFGDYFVQGIQTGAAYYGLLEFTSESAEQQRKISAQLDAGVTGLFKASTRFSETLTSITKDTSLRVDSFQIGGQSGTQPTTVDGIIQKAAEFPNEARNSGVTKQALIQDYKTLDLPPSPNFIDIENARLVLSQFFRLRNMLVTKLNNINYIQENPEQFENVEQFNLEEGRNKIQNSLDSITQKATSCVNNVTQCQFDTDIIPTIALPKRKEIAGNAHFNNISSKMKITSLKRINNEDRLLVPVYRFTQPDLNGNPSWEIYTYDWKEPGNPAHFDVEATVGIHHIIAGGYIIEISRLTGHDLKIEIDGNTYMLQGAVNPNQSNQGFTALSVSE